ncbi:MAG: TIGR00730 family Rossman fold protein [Bryobacteraceae bacterium]
MPDTIQRVCVFCGSSAGARPVYRDAARQVGQLLAGRGIEVVYGGGHVGLMGVVADSALEYGGRVIGVIPEALAAKEVAHLGLSELHVVGSMHERKALMAELSDAFLAMPGGFGTFEELCEVLTWSQLGLHEKACGVLNVEGYYDPLLALFDHAMNECFLRPVHRDILIADSDAGRLIEKLATYRSPHVEKWITPDET